MTNASFIIPIEGGTIGIAACDCALGHVAEAEIDLTPWAGETIRIWLEEDKTYSLDRHRNHYWQVGQIDVPPLEYSETEDVDGEGNPTVIREALPLDLSNVEILVWDLPV